MLEKDFNQHHPSAGAISSLFDDLPITVEQYESEAIDAMLSALRYVFANGKAKFTSFLIGPSPVLDYFGVRDQLDEIQF